MKLGEYTYVRTYKGRIYKVTNLNIFKVVCGHTTIRYENIKSHSENLIDLIEVGDYVNGKYVYDVFEAVTTGGKLVKVDCMRGYYKPEEIEEIVTHEQFERAKFVVGGKEND